MTSDRLSRLPRLSRVVMGGGLVFLAILWLLYASITLSERASNLAQVHDHLADVAAAYGEHAVTLMQDGLAIKVRNAPGGQSAPGATGPGEAALARFRAILDVKGITLSILRDGALPAPGVIAPGVADVPEFHDRNGRISAVVQRHGAGIAVTASTGDNGYQGGSYPASST